MLCASAQRVASGWLVSQGLVAARGVAAICVLSAGGARLRCPRERILSFRLVVMGRGGGWRTMHGDRARVRIAPPFPYPYAMMIDGKGQMPMTYYVYALVHLTIVYVCRILSLVISPLENGGLLLLERAPTVAAPPYQHPDQDVWVHVYPGER